MHSTRRQAPGAKTSIIDGVVEHPQQADPGGDGSTSVVAGFLVTPVGVEQRLMDCM
jgi:hypothetical protein